MPANSEVAELETLMTELLQHLAGNIKAHTPQGWGFVLILTEMERTDGQIPVLYVADIEQEGALDTIEEWLKQMRAGNQHPPDPAALPGGNA